MLQSALDFQSGLLQSEDNDFKTAYSYFFEAFESYNNASHKKALIAFKYMLLAKIMMGDINDVYQFLNGKYSLNYRGRELDAVKAIADASKEKNLE